MYIYVYICICIYPRLTRPVRITHFYGAFPFLNLNIIPLLILISHSYNIFPLPLGGVPCLKSSFLIVKKYILNYIS